MAEQLTNGHDKKVNKRNGGKGKWADPEYRKSYQAKWRKRKKLEAKGVTKRPYRKAAKKDGRYDDAIVYLRMAVNSVNSRIASGELADDDMAHLLTKLALKTLRGEK